MAKTAELQERFQSLVDENRGILYKVCNSYCADRNDRDDLAQEILIQLWRAFPKFDGSFRFSTWMYRIALNVAISFYRRESVRTRHVIPSDERVWEVAEDAAGQPEQIRLLYRLIESLDALNKALVLLYLDGHTHREIAAVLGISETNVATKINRLKTTLKQQSQGA